MSQLGAIISYVSTYVQPLTGLFIGAGLLGLVAYINWYGSAKADVVRWIAKHIFHNDFKSEKSADGLFMAVTSLLLLIGGLWIILAVQYLGA
jgi:hypothetical protein